jgi:hypothetical protein
MSGDPGGLCILDLDLTRRLNRPAGLASPCSAATPSLRWSISPHTARSREASGPSVPCRR